MFLIWQPHMARKLQGTTHPLEPQSDHEHFLCRNRNIFASFLYLLTLTKWGDHTCKLLYCHAVSDETRMVTIYHSGLES